MPAKRRIAAGRRRAIEHAVQATDSAPSHATGCGRRRHSHAGSPTSASMISAPRAPTARRRRAARQRFTPRDFGGEPIERLRQHRSAAHRQLLGQDEALVRRIERLEGGMQQERLALVFGEFAVARHQQQVRSVGDDLLERDETADPAAELARRVGEPGRRRGANS